MKLSQSSLEFARAHIEAFWDSDFFPKPDVYQAIWAKWPEVCHLLTTRNAENFARTGGRQLPAPKSRGGFRIVHQLDPLSAIVYTALAHKICGAVESARVPVSERTVLSYRIAPDQAGFFARGNGYAEFVELCRELAHQYPFVLACDIAEFYNRIYLHRVQNNVESCGQRDAANCLESFLLKLNLKASQGIPVGPAASIVISEAALIDVDQFVARTGLRYVRYVDDLRIFADNAEALRATLEELVGYLFEAHRLQLAWGKTEVTSSADFVARYLDAPHRIEQRELLGVAQSVADYGDTFVEMNSDELVQKFMDVDQPLTEEKNELRDILAFWLSAEERERRLVRDHALARLLKIATDSTPFDLGLARYVLRRGRSLNVADLFPVVLDRFDTLAPAAPDVFLFLEKVGAAEVLEVHRARLVALSSGPGVRRSRFVQHWLQWFYTSSEHLLKEPDIRRYVYQQASAEFQARAAHKLRDLAWLRQRKSELAHMGPWDRWSTVLASRVMAREERRAWLQSVVTGDSDSVDRLLVEWVVAQP